jgi:putative RecB family exonuclease
MIQPSLALLRQRRHLSYSQLNTFLTCPLRYRFQYVEGRPPQHLSSSLLLGSAIHSALADYFFAQLETGEPATPERLLGFFHDDLRQRLASATAPVLFQSDAGDADGLRRQGEALLRAFLADPGPSSLQVVAVELPLSTGLHDDQGKPTGIQLLGVIDLLLRDELGRLIALDHKTAKNPISQDAADSDLQLSAYAELLRRCGTLGADETLCCGFHVLRKLKTPKIERVMTRRQPSDGRRFCRLAGAVLAAIEAQACYPCPGWACGDCPYQQACRLW